MDSSSCKSCTSVSFASAFEYARVILTLALLGMYKEEHGLGSSVAVVWIVGMGLRNLATVALRLFRARVLSNITLAKSVMTSCIGINCVSMRGKIDLSRGSVIGVLTSFPLEVGFLPPFLAFALSESFFFLGVMDAVLFRLNDDTTMLKKNLKLTVIDTNKFGGAKLQSFMRPKLSLSLRQWSREFLF
jgi:hypothetical protein